MGNFKNEFNWSVTRHATFQKCLRAYYYHYYGSWGGWDPNFDLVTRRLYIMKNLLNTKMFIGQIVHRVIVMVITTRNNRKPVTEEKAVDQIEKMMQFYWNELLKKRYLRDPKKYPGLLHHYYKNALFDGGLQMAIDYAVGCIRQLFRTVVYQEIKSGSNFARLEVEQLRDIQIKGLKVFCMMDLIYEEPSGNVLIVDWKSGEKTQADSIRTQLSVYAKAAIGLWGYSVGQIKTKEVNLFYGTEKAYSISDNDLNETTEFIVNSANGMKAKLRDPISNTACKDDFPKNKTCQYCSSCNFQGMY